MVTIYDIAEKTGFSAPTISKALNGTGGLSQATRKKILDTAENLGYRPNMAARSLTTKKSFLIGIIFEDLDMQRGFEHPLFGGILNRFRAEIEAAGYDLIFLSHGFLEKKKSYVEYCHYRNLDAVVVINPAEATSILELAESSIPCVSTNFIVPGIPAVVTANFDAGFRAGEFLLQNGHRKIAYIAGSFNEFNNAALERLDGLKKSLSEGGISLDDSCVEYCTQWSRENARNAMEKILLRHPDTTAVFVANDNMAVGAMEAVQSAGKKIPDDVSFIGFDDEMFSSLCNPPLTTFRQNRNLIAELSAEILMNRIAGIPVKDIVRIPAEFIVRDSVKNLRVQ